MSSQPKIVIAPKKKKKPLIIVSKQQLQQRSGSAAAARPASPNTVAAAAAAAGGGASNAPSTAPLTMGTTISGGVGSKKSKSSSSSTILIKPFEKPPELPHDFYDSSLHTLRRALICVLRHEALLDDSTGGGGGVGSGGNSGIGSGGGSRLIGREELYRTVEDLCVHKFGTNLYYDLVAIMEDAAAEVVRRLATNDSSSSTASSWDHPLHDHSKNSMDVVVVGGVGRDTSIDAIVDRVTGDVGYNAAQLVNDLNLRDGGSCESGGGGGGDSDDVWMEYSDKRYALLTRMHSICRVSYAEEYLTFLRSIFLTLDRAYVYYADVELEEVGSGNEQRKTMKQMAAKQHSSMGDDSNVTGSSLPPGGHVIERSTASVSNPRVWGLWDVGIACLRQHMLRTPKATKELARPSGDSSDDVMGGTLPVLTTMILTTAYAVLSEFDHPHTSFSSSMSDTRPLTRNCVRTIIDLGSLPALLEELIVVASARFEKEGKAWGVLLNEGRKSASEFLLHVEHRLRQSRSLSGYYLPGNPASVAALRRLSRLTFLTGTVPSRLSNRVVWSSANDSTRRIFPALIEKQLLGPHLSLPDAGIFESRHLYPMLDDDNGVGGDMAWKTHPGGSKLFENAKRLYGLCWRLTALAFQMSQQSAQPSSGITTPSPTSALDLLRQAFGKYGRLRGYEIVQQGLPKQPSEGTKTNINSKEMEKKVIPDLLSFRHHLNSLHTIAFQGDESFGVMVRSILDDVLNGSDSGPSLSAEIEEDGGRRTAELLAKHVDMRFKDAKASVAPEASSTSTNLFAAAIATDANESFQNDVFALFRHLHSKDVFEAFYKRDLAKRLLTGRAVSTDMEWSFLTKLKAECGAAYTSKMEGMFKDMELSRDIMSSYAAYSAGASTSSSAAGAGPVGKTVDMDVQVLTTGYWPVYPKYPNLILPPELLGPRTKFENYYTEKYQGRRITWQYSLGNCIVKACFPKSVAPKELVVNMCQSLVLLCFNVGDGEIIELGLTLDDIMKKTGIDDRPELERVLQSLSLGRDGTRVLRKVDYDSPTQPMSSSKTSDSNNDPAKKQRVRRNVGPYDRFFFNSSFTSNQRRIRITNITMKETSEERTKTHEAVSNDRLWCIDAAVVRIMKARKAIDHRDLIGEVMAQLKFPATAADIKKRIEGLIDREYMERVEGDRSKYKYLA